jgi:hypothetical protein
MKKSTMFFVLALVLAFQSAAQTTIFPFGSAWRYLDNGSNQGTAWRETAFNDGSWKAGNGLFGYGYRNETTVVSYGPDPANRYLTTYFRKAMSIADVSAFTAFTGRVKRDDGVVVYVNGMEVFRNNLPTGTITYTTRAASASDNGQTPQTFNIPRAAFVSGNNVIAVEVHQTGRDSFDLVFDLELTATGGTPPGDQPPAVLSLNRHVPTSQNTTATALIFRVTFSEAVKGVDAGDFQRVGAANGAIAALVAASSSGTTYDLSVTGVSGSGVLGVNLKSSGTGITDAAGNPLSGGFTGQSYIIGQSTVKEGFASLTPLARVAAIADATKGMAQAKVFAHAGKHWAVFANGNGTHLWRLDATTWTRILTLSADESRADCIVDGNIAHILLFNGTTTALMSLEYVPAANTYQLWSKRKTKVSIALDKGVESASLACDGNDRLWLISDVVTDIHARWSDAPYTQWSSPIKIASGLNDDDISAVIYMPASRKIGVLWSDQKTDRFGFRTHADGQSPTSWTANEVPASQSALNVGKGMADDHLNMKVAQDGTLYCAVKTGFDEPGYPKIGLLVRRPSGSWDKLHKVSEEGTVPIVILNEATGKVRVIYTSQTYGGDILYRESDTGNIAFGKEFTLIKAVYNYASSSHQNFTSEVVIIASFGDYVAGVLAREGSVSSTASGITAPLAEMALPPEPDARVSLLAAPNPFSSATTIRFTLPVGGAYNLVVYDSKQVHQVFSSQGKARAGEELVIEIAAQSLARGLYIARLQANGTTSNLRLLLDR